MGRVDLETTEQIVFTHLLNDDEIVHLTLPK